MISEAMQLHAKTPQHSAPDLTDAVRAARTAQHIWAQTPMRSRMALVRQVRHAIAESALQLAETVPTQQPGALQRNTADTLAAEVLPLAEACRFLEQEAAWILAARQLSTRTRPFWLRRIQAEVVREPFGVVLIVAPANYPLFLPGVQAMQALAAGNAVLWKPARGGTAAAHALRYILVESGLEPALVQILDERPEAAVAAIDAGVDKVFLTGSAHTGRAVQHQLANQLTPSVMELSGCDAVFVLPHADLERTIDALAFGLRLNGSATCMSPRRVFLIGTHPHFLPALLEKLSALPLLTLPDRIHARLHDLLSEASLYGATVLHDKAAHATRYAVVDHARPEMRIAQTDIFAPVLSLIHMPDIDSALAAYALCPYALTAAVFGPESPARKLVPQIKAGTVLINDLIVSTADPRVPFGGRGSSGFGTTRGAEGLLEMTTPKAVVVQRSRDRRAYQPTTPNHADLFAAYLRVAHGARWSSRLRGMAQLIRSALRVR